jgi:hypothetical protein
MMTAIDQINLRTAVLHAAGEYARALADHPESWMRPEGEAPTAFRVLLERVNEMEAAYQAERCYCPKEAA